VLEGTKNNAVSISQIFSIKSNISINLSLEQFEVNEK